MTDGFVTPLHKPLSWHVFQIKVENDHLVDELGGNDPEDTFSTWLTKGFPWPENYRRYASLDTLIRHGILATQGPSIGMLLDMDMPRMRNMVMCGSPHFYYSGDEEELMICTNCKERCTNFITQIFKNDKWFRIAYCARCETGIIEWGPAGPNPMMFLESEALLSIPSWAVIAKLNKAAESKRWVIIHQLETPNFYVLYKGSAKEKKDPGFLGQLTYHNGSLHFINAIQRDSLPGGMLGGHSMIILDELVEDLKAAITKHTEDLLTQPELKPWPHYYGGLSFYWDLSSGDKLRAPSYWGPQPYLEPAGKYINPKQVHKHSTVYMMIGWY